MKILSNEEFSKLGLNNAKEYIIQMINELPQDYLEDLYEDMLKIVVMTDKEFKNPIGFIDII